MSFFSKNQKKENTSKKQLIEGIDFYLENGFFVFTGKYLKERGYCCKSGCRHCPYGFEKKKNPED